MLLVKSCVEIVDNFYPPVCIIWKIAQWVYIRLDKNRGKIRAVNKLFKLYTPLKVA